MLVMHATLPSDTPASNTHNLWCWGSRLLSYSIIPNKSAILVRDAGWWGSIGDGWLYIVFPRYTLPRKPTAVSFSLHIRLLPGRVSWLPIDNTHSHLCIHPTHGLLTLQIAPIIASSSSHSPTTCLPYLHCNPVSVVSSCWIACTRSRMSASLELGAWSLSATILRRLSPRGHRIFFTSEATHQDPVDQAATLPLGEQPPIGTTTYHLSPGDVIH